jgi:hypothetical protein
MDTLTNIVKQVVFSYAGGSDVVRTFKLSNDEQQVYAVNIIDVPVRHYPTGIMVMAHIEGDIVIIDEDLTDRPLVEALVRAGIPREKIVLAYAGEPLPATP